jgi:hypothetical protein
MDNKFWGKNKHELISPQSEAILERYAASNQFEKGMHREAAEKEAYKAHVKEQVTDAALHHLAHLKASVELGDPQSASKHKHLFDTYSKIAGLDQIDAARELKRRQNAGHSFGEHGSHTHPVDQFVSKLNKPKL